MSDRMSLADQAVAVLAAVSAMDSQTVNDHEERHTIRTLKRLAQARLDAAFREAQELAFLALSIYNDAERSRSEKDKQ